MIKDIEELMVKMNVDIRNNMDVAVIGMSGGADSTLVAILCTEALGINNVYGVHMPYNVHDRLTFNLKSRDICERLGIHEIAADISNIADEITKGLSSIFDKKEINKVNQGNARSRSRMCMLYGIAWELNAELNKRVRVVGTGNLSEDYIGYDTKGGDALADIFPIGELFKSEVYQLLDYFRDKDVITEEMIDRVPSAGLWEGQTDEKELGYSYNEMEQSIKEHMTGTCKQPINDMVKFISIRYRDNSHKHKSPPVIKVRKYCD